MNKYHKPYAKEICAASIRGEAHPALKKLGHKLGLSRPTDDYQELKMGTHEGKAMIPLEYIHPREDGTVWFGSTLNTIGTSSKSYTPPSTTTTTTAAAATACTTTTTASAKGDHAN